MSGFEGTDIECSIRTEGNRTLERPGAWALLGRAERQDKRGDERRDRVPTLRSATDGRAARLVERSDEARGRTSPLPRRRMEAEELGRRRSGVRASPSPQRPRRGSPVVRRADPACPGESSCKCLRRDRVSCLGPYNRGRQRRASEAKRSPLHAGLAGARTDELEKMSTDGCFEGRVRSGSLAPAIVAVRSLVSDLPEAVVKLARESRGKPIELSDALE